MNTFIFPWILYCTSSFQNVSIFTCLPSVVDPQICLPLCSVVPVSYIYPRLTPLPYNLSSFIAMFRMTDTIVLHRSLTRLLCRLDRRKFTSSHCHIFYMCRIPTTPTYNQMLSLQSMYSPRPGLLILCVPQSLLLLFLKTLPPCFPTCPFKSVHTITFRDCVSLIKSSTWLTSSAVPMVSAVPLINLCRSIDGLLPRIPCQEYPSSALRFFWGVVFTMGCSSWRQPQGAPSLRSHKTESRGSEGFGVRVSCSQPCLKRALHTNNCHFPC